MLMSLADCFLQLTDPRRASGLRHPLVPFLCMVTMGYLSGYSGYREIGTFMEANKEEFVKMFELKHGVPKFVQIRTIIRKLDFRLINKVFLHWISQFVSIDGGEWISGDGKGLNSTLQDAHSSSQDFELMVRLFSHKLGLVLYTGSARSKKGEILALRELLKQLELKGVIITLDAVHCQKKQ